MSGRIEIGDLSPRRYFAVLALVLGLLFALIGGEDDDGISLLRSIVQWQLQSCVPMALLLLTHIQCSKLNVFDRLGPWSQLMISGVLGAALFAPFALALDIHLFSTTAEGFNGRELFDEFLNLAPPVVLTWVAINAPFILGFRLRASAADATAVPSRSDSGGIAEHQALPPPDSSPAFLMMVAPEDRGPVIYLQAELHYLAVITQQRRSLILYNLRDAIGEMNVTGLQTHRSFWVNLAAVETYKRSGRQGTLTMKNGDQVPVSRRRITAVEKALRCQS